MVIGWLFIGTTSFAQSWDSSCGVKIQIDDSFKLKRSAISNGNRDMGRQCYIYTRKGGEILIISEVFLKNGKTWGKGYDPVLKKDQRAKSGAILEYSANKYAVYKSVFSSSRRPLKIANVKLPKCYVMVVQAKIGPSRSKGVWCYGFSPIPNCRDKKHFAFGSYIDISKLVKFK